jgi:hypothetical protein
MLAPDLALGLVDVHFFCIFFCSIAGQRPQPHLERNLQTQTSILRRRCLWSGRVAAACNHNRRLTRRRRVARGCLHAKQPRHLWRRNLLPDNWRPKQQVRGSIIAPCCSFPSFVQCAHVTCCWASWLACILGESSSCTTGAWDTSCCNMIVFLGTEQARPFC